MERPASCHAHVVFPHRPVLVFHVVTQPCCCGKPGHLVPQRGDDVSYWPQMLIQPSHESTAEHVGLFVEASSSSDGSIRSALTDIKDLSCPDNPVDRITGSSSMKLRDKGLQESLLSFLRSCFLLEQRVDDRVVAMLYPRMSLSRCLLLSLIKSIDSEPLPLHSLVTSDALSLVFWLSV